MNRPTFGVMWFFLGKETAMAKHIAANGTIYAGLLAILLAPIMANAQRQPDSERAAPVAKISEEQATKIALELIPGTVTEVKIERKKGRHVYVVEIQTPNEGEKDVFVDIQTGKIVGTD
jgi:uncharacterized membrane protein YkoI